MQYIRVRNLKKYQASYKDRKLIWAKIYLSLIQGDEDAELLGEVSWSRLVKFIVLETTRAKATPLDENFLRKRGFDFSTESLEQTLKNLSHFVDIINVTECDESVTETAPRLEERRQEKRRGEGEAPSQNVSRETILRTENPLDPRNLLAADLFCGLTQTQKDAIVDMYPADFLTNALSGYISTAEQRRIFRMNPGTVFNWLERDFRITQTAKSGPAQTLSKKQAANMEALDEFERTA